jgi:hypothetical protein
MAGRTHGLDRWTRPPSTLFITFSHAMDASARGNVLMVTTVAATKVAAMATICRPAGLGHRHGRRFVGSSPGGRWPRKTAA